mgnify:CR=1 FL=1|jgi:hypothetical protein
MSCDCIPTEPTEVLTWWIDVVSDQMAVVPTDGTPPGWRKITVITTLEDLDMLRDLLIRQRASLPTWSGS